MYGYGAGVGWMIVMSVLSLIVIAAVVWAVVRLAVGFDGPSRRESPLEILDRRLASGEIDATAYDDARARLTDTRSSR